MQDCTENDLLSTSFKKGMSLNEYLTEMNPVSEGKYLQDEEEDLYQTSRKVKPSMSKKLITYEIRESDEDNYDQSNEERNIENSQVNLSTQLTFYNQRKSNKNLLKADPETKNSLSNSRGFRVRHQSNSPFNNLKKESSSFSPNKNLSRTLQSNQWKLSKELPARHLPPSTTLYGKFLKGLKDKQYERPKENSKQKHFKKKNTQEIQYVIKYERDKNCKYSKNNSPEMFDMCVEGITDRLRERKYLQGKSIK